MKEEVDSATSFLGGLIANKVSRSFLESFKINLANSMIKRYQDHWHPQKPQRGSAYRSITIHYNHVDNLISDALRKACTNTKSQENVAVEVGKHFPQELVLWVDPMDVSYRIGDNGSIGVVYAGPSTSVTSDSESEMSISSSPSNSPVSSPCSSPVSSPPRPYHMGYLQPPSPAHHSFPQQCRQQAFQSHQYYRNGSPMVYS